MANRKILVDNAGAGPAVWTAQLDTTGQLNLGDAALGAVGSWVLQISGTFSGSLVLRKKVIGSIVADASAPATFYENSATGRGERSDGDYGGGAVQGAVRWLRADSGLHGHERHDARGMR
jgi:hypothetical protein